MIKDVNCYKDVKSMLKRVTNLITVHLDNLSNYQGLDCYYVFEKCDCDC